MEDQQKEKLENLITEVIIDNPLQQVISAVVYLKCRNIEGLKDITPREITAYLQGLYNSRNTTNENNPMIVGKPLFYFNESLLPIGRTAASVILYWVETFKNGVVTPKEIKEEFPFIDIVPEIATYKDQINSKYDGRYFSEPEYTLFDSNKKPLLLSSQWDLKNFLPIKIYAKNKLKIQIRKSKNRVKSKFK